MTDSTWAIQISPKLPDGTLINVRADTPEQLDTLLGYVQNKGADIASAVQALVAGGAVAGAFPGSQNVQPDAATAAVQQAQSPAWGSQPPPAQGPPQWAGQQQAPAGGQPPAPQCPHGAMQYRESKPGAARAWKAWMCPTPKDTPGQCDPQWLKG